MDTSAFEFVIRIILAVAVFISLIYFVFRFIQCSRWDSIESEIKKFASFQYILQIKIEETHDANKVKTIRLLNFLLKIQYAVWIATFLGMMVIAIIDARPSTWGIVFRRCQFHDHYQGAKGSFRFVYLSWFNCKGVCAYNIIDKHS